MDFLTALIPIAGIMTGLVLGIYGINLEREKVRAKAAIKSGGADAARLEGVVTEMQGEVQRLRDRVAVLERLVTDDDRRLSAEISRLSAGERNAPR